MCIRDSSEDSFIQCTYFLYSSLSHPLLQVLMVVQILIVVHIVEADISGDIVFPGFRGDVYKRQ